MSCSVVCYALMSAKFLNSFLMGIFSSAFCHEMFYLVNVAICNTENCKTKHFKSRNSALSQH